LVTQAFVQRRVWAAGVRSGAISKFAKNEAIALHRLSQTTSPTPLSYFDAARLAFSPQGSTVGANLLGSNK
jgi:hypothetical protein